MSKYGAEVREKAYELFMIQAMPIMDVVRELKIDYPNICKTTISRWSNNHRLDWDGRYHKYCRALAEKTDEERLKQYKPILHTIQEIREKVYDQIITVLNAEKSIITDKNLSYILSSFVKLGELEYKMTGGKAGTPVKQVINVILMVLEKNPNIGPVLKAHKHEIVDAVFEVIKSET